jgi:hypothetical protein
MAVNKVVLNRDGTEEILIDISDSTVTPETLAEGETAYGKNGEKIVGVMEVLSGGGLPSGVSALASGTYTPTADLTASVNIEHGLGVAPNFSAWIIEDGSFADTPIKLALIGGLAFAKTMKKEASDSTRYNYHYYLRSYTNAGAAGYSCSQSTTNYLTTTTLRLHASAAAKLLGGYTYRWVCGVLDGIE